MRSCLITNVERKIPMRAEKPVARALFILALIALTCTIAARVFLLATEPINQDETDALQKAWLIDQGQEMYLDFFELRTPLLFQSLRPFVRWIHQPSIIIISARIAQLILTLFCFIFLFLLAEILAGQSAAYWALILASFFNFFAARSIQTRPEPLMLLLALAGLWLFAFWREKRGPYRQILLAGFLFGLAFMTKVSAFFILLAPLLLLMIQTAGSNQNRQKNVLDMILLGSGALIAVMLVMFFSCGRQTPAAFSWIYKSTSILRHSEGFHRTGAPVFRTFTTNGFLWLLLIVGYFSLFYRWFSKQNRRRLGWKEGLLTLLGLGGGLSLIARWTLFEQDLILPALLMVPAGGYWLSERFRGGSLRANWLPSAASSFIFLLLFGSFLTEIVLTHRNIQLNIFSYHKVAGMMWKVDIPTRKPVVVDASEFTDLLRGEHDRIHYYPTRSLARGLKLADKAMAFVSPDGIVFSDTSIAIKRAEPHRLIKTAVFHHAALLEAEENAPICQSLKRFMPGACDPEIKPAQRLLGVLETHEPDLIVFGYATADIIAQYPPIRWWLMNKYQVWYDPATWAFLGIPKDQTWQ